MAVKVVMTWDLKRGNEQEYFEFVVSDYLPKVNQLGLVLTDAWLTAYVGWRCIAYGNQGASSTRINWLVGFGKRAA